jgi:magnesium chelatase family protein
MPGESKSSPREIQNYLGRISGPLLDRIDLHIEVPPVKLPATAPAKPRRKSAGASSPRASASTRGLRTSQKSPATREWGRAN